MQLVMVLPYTLGVFTLGSKTSYQLLKQLKLPCINCSGKLVASHYIRPYHSNYK
jgi:hypothetical protein